MTQVQLIADEIVRTITGPMWHGPALAEVLAGVTSDQATRRPIHNAHTIWELVLHVTAWAEIAHARLGGTPRVPVSPEEDWPPTPSASERAWRAACAHLEERHRVLAAFVAHLTESRLDARVAGHDYSARTLLQGVVEHGTYHAGQIALLRKLLDE